MDALDQRSGWRFGPLEWLWRGMTYGKFPWMRKEEPMPAIEVPSLSSSPITLSAVEHARTAIGAIPDETAE